MYYACFKARTYIFINSVTYAKNQLFCPLLVYLWESEMGTILNSLRSWTKWSKSKHNPVICCTVTCEQPG